MTMASSRVRGSRRVRLQVVVATALSALVLAGCGGGASSSAAGPVPVPDTASTETAGLPPEPLPEPTTIKIGYSGPYELYSTIGLADRMGEFARENIRIEWIVGATADLFPQLGQGATDVQLSGLTPAALNAMNAGLKIRGVAPITDAGSSEDGVWVRSNLAAAAPGSLSGKTIGMQQGTGSIAMVPLKSYLDSGGVQLSDVTIEALNAGQDLVQAFRSGAIDALWAVFPQTQALKESGDAQRVTTSSPGVIGVWFGPNLLDRNRDAGVAFTRALARTNRLYLQPGYKNDPKVVSAIAEFTGQPEDAVRQSPESAYSGDLRMDTSTVEQLQQIWLSYGGIVAFDTPIPGNQIADTSLIAEALGQ